VKASEADSIGNAGMHHTVRATPAQSEPTTGGMQEGRGGVGTRRKRWESLAAAAAAGWEWWGGCTGCGCCYSDDRRPTAAGRLLMARPITLHVDDARSVSLLSGCIHIETPV